MAFFEDLSVGRLFPDDESSSIEFRNIGWLEKGHPFPQGSIEQALLRRLWQFCRFPLVEYRGFHFCDLCPDQLFSGFTFMKFQGEIIGLGDSTSCLFFENTYFLFPNLIFHYIINHNYQPPEEFLFALLHASLPKSREYSNFRRTFGFDFYDMIITENNADYSEAVKRTSGN